MKRTLLISALLAVAGYTAAESYTVADLGKALTPWGAIQAGNADGSIPAYAGGMTTPPPDYDPARPGWRPNPFREDRPVVRINRSNMNEHQGRLSAAVMELMRRHENFFIDVYPTRRSVAYPEEVIRNTLLNAERCATTNGAMGIDTSRGCGFGIPFPVPKNGLEVMWNHGAGAYRTVAFVQDNYQGMYVKPSGEVVHSYTSQGYRYSPFYDTRMERPDAYYGYRFEYTSPSRLAGSNNIVLDMIANSERRAYAYSPATRRVRLAPDNAGDTPVSQVGGAMTYDDDWMFSGRKDRYEWVLLGRKEMYIPYNNYRYQYTDKDDTACQGAARLTPYFPNPECIRWELHRVWHVQARLRDGQRHIYSKRDIYIDEDSLTDGLAETYDQAGNLYRLNLQIGSPLYEVPATSVTNNTVIDLISGVYALMGTATDERGGIRVVEPLPRELMTPASLNRRVIR